MSLPYGSYNHQSPYAYTTPITSSTSAARTNHERLAQPQLPRNQQPSVQGAFMPGRIQLKDGESPFPYSLHGDTGKSTSTPNTSIANLGSMQQPTVLSRAYFSAANIQIIQNALRKGVHDATNIVVDEQNTEQLQLVMRSVFLQYSRNQTHSAEVIREQIEEMNQKVIEYCVPVVVSNVKQYQQYLVDVSTMPTPMSHGLATSQAGSRSLEMKPFM